MKCKTIRGYENNIIRNYTHALFNIMGQDPFHYDDIDYIIYLEIVRGSEK